MTVPADELEPCGLRLALLPDLGRLVGARELGEGDFARIDLPQLLDERFMLALRYANPEVAARVERLLLDLRGNPGRHLAHGQRQTVSTVLGYLWRAAFNPTPFGAFAGSGWIGDLRSSPTACSAVRANFKLLHVAPVSGRPCLSPFEITDKVGEDTPDRGDWPLPPEDRGMPGDRNRPSCIDVIVLQQPMSSDRPNLEDADARRLAGWLRSHEPARPRLEVELQVPAFQALPPQVSDTVRRLGAMHVRADHHGQYLSRLRHTLASEIRMRDGSSLPAPALLEATRRAAAGSVPDIEFLAELAACGECPQWQDPLSDLTDHLTAACLDGQPVDGLQLLDGRCEAGLRHTRLGGSFRRRSLGDREEWLITRLTGRSASLLPRIGGHEFDVATTARLSRWYGRWPFQADLCVPISTDEDARPRLTRVAIDCTESATERRHADCMVPWTKLQVVPGPDEWQICDASCGLVEPVHLGVASRHLLPESARWLLGLPTVPCNALEALLKAWNRAIGRALTQRPLHRLPELRLGPALIASPLMGVLTAADVTGASAFGPARARQRIRLMCLERIGECGLARVLAAGRFGQPRTIDLATPWGIDQLVRLMSRCPLAFLEPLEPLSFGAGRGLELVTEFDCSCEQVPVERTTG